MPHDYSNWNTGQKIRDHELATAIINGHTSDEGNYVFDEQCLATLKKFCDSPTIATRDRILAEKEVEDTPGAQYPGEKAAGNGDLVSFLIARHATNDPAFDDRDIELLKEWYDAGMPTGQEVSR